MRLKYTNLLIRLTLAPQLQSHYLIVTETEKLFEWNFFQRIHHMFLKNPKSTNLRIFLEFSALFFRGMQSDFFCYGKQLYKHI